MMDSSCSTRRSVAETSLEGGGASLHYQVQYEFHTFNNDNNAKWASPCAADSTCNPFPWTEEEAP